MVGMRVVLIPRSPWAVLLQGLGIVALGVVLVAWPHASIEVVRIAFGVLAPAYGAMQALAAFFEKHEGRWWRIPLALPAATSGVVALAWPGATERVTLILLGLWFLFTGLTILAAGLMLPADMSSRWVVALAGAALFIFGVFLAGEPLGQDAARDNHGPGGAHRRLRHLRGHAHGLLFSPAAQCAGGPGGSVY